MSEQVIISITNSKGGVGKTTTALNLGVALGREGRRVLLLDNDPQGNLTAALGYTPGTLKYTLSKLLLTVIDTPEDVEQHLPRTILHTQSGVDLIPSNGRLADAAARLQVMRMSQAAQYQGVEGELVCEKVMEALLGYLEENYDYIIIDCGLKHELLTVNALAASSYCIIPVQAHFLASEGIPDVLGLVRSVRDRLNPRLKGRGGRGGGAGMNLLICTCGEARPVLLHYLDGLDVKLREKVTLELAMLSRTPMGLLGEPHVKHFSLERYRELYELRAKGKDMVRIIFTRLPGGKILLLHPFTKKQPRDTEKALETAMKLLEDVRADRCGTMELPVHELKVGPP